MACRTISSATRLKIDFGDKGRHKRLDPREPHKHAVEGARHASRARAFPGIGRQGRLDECGHGCRFDTLAGHIAQNHDGAVVGKADERIEVAADQCGVRGRQVYRIGRDTRNIAERIPHTDLKRLGDMALLALLRLTFIDQLKIVGQVHQVVVFKVVNRFLTAVAKQQGTRRRPLSNVGGHDSVVIPLNASLRTNAPCFNAGIDIETLARQAVSPQPYAHGHRLINARQANVLQVIDARTAQDRHLKTIRCRTQTRSRRRSRKEERLRVPRQRYTTTALKIDDIGFEARIVLHRTEMAIEHSADLGRYGARSSDRIIEIGKELIAQHIERTAKLCGTTRTQTRCHTDQLDRQIIANDLEHVYVIGKRRLGAFPTDFQHTENLRAVKHGKTDFAAVWRHILHTQQVLGTIIQIHEHTRGDSIALKVLLDRKTASARLTKNVRRNASAIGHELGQIAVLKLLGNAAELKAATLGKIDSGARCIERSDKLIQNGIEQAGKLIGANGTHNDRKRARKTLIRHPELR